MKFSEAVGCSQEEVIRFWDQLPIIPRSSGVGRGGLRGAEAPPPKCVKGARVMGVGTLLAYNVTLLILSIMQLTQLICSHDHTVRCSQ